MEELLQVWQNSLRKPDQAAREAAQRQWDSIAKPLGSLGALEKLVMEWWSAAPTTVWSGRA